MESKISVLQDAYQDMPQTMVNAYILDNYAFPLIELSCKRDMFHEFETQLSEIYDFKKYLFDVTTSNKTIFLEAKGTFLIHCNTYGTKDTYNVNIYCNSIEMTENLYKIFKKYEHNDDESAVINFVTTSISGNKLSESYINFNVGSFDEESESYYPYMDVNEMYKQFILSDENILVLYGEPGTGKTKAVSLFMKYLLNNPDIAVDKEMNEYVEDEDRLIFSVSYVKNEDVLSMDGYWDTLNRNNYALVFLDDADYCLTSRTNDINTNADISKNKFLNQLLSYTDGIIKNNTKFIITTNIDMGEIDAAVLRQGRTFNIIKLRRLKESEALKIWINKGYTKEQYFMHLQPGDVSAAELGSAINKQKIIEKSGELKQYIFEDGISLLNKNKPEKVGFL